MSDRLEELTAGWRAHHHEGWAQRWLTHMLGQVECSTYQYHNFRRAECECTSSSNDCCFTDHCQHCGAAL